MFHCAMVMGFLLAFIINSKLCILNEILAKCLETIIFVLIHACVTILLRYMVKCRRNLNFEKNHTEPSREKK